MKSKQIFPLVLFFFSCCFLWSQGTSNFSLNLISGAKIPIGGSSELYSTGASFNLNGEFYPDFLPLIYGKSTLGYNILPTLADSNMAIADFSIGAGAAIPVLPRLFFKVSGSGGMYIGMREGESGSDPFFSAGIELKYLINRSLSLGIESSYINYISTNIMEPLYQGMSVSIGLTYNMGASSRDSEFRFIPEFDTIFPVFYKYYDNNPVGSVILQNMERGKIDNVKISLFVPDFMNQPKLCAELDQMQQKEEIEIPLYALFTDDILKVTEGTKVSAEIQVEYDFLGSRVAGKRIETLTVNNRNAMTWDDDRKAASFVTAKDPAVLRFSKGVAADISNIGSGAVNSNFRMAVGIFEALSIFGIGYVIDPTSSYIELSEDALAVDYLQFPSQSLLYRAGDCDDLSILYTALLESVGIKTSFITIPGHIYMAFSPDITQNEAEKLFSDAANLIFLDGETWIPVEITMIKDGFIKAWEAGAREWRNNFIKDSAVLVPIHEAWELYEPVGISGVDRGTVYPESKEIITRYNAEMEKFVTREIHERVLELQEKIRQSRNNPRIINKLGVLYARFGKYREAEEEFNKALSKADYIPSMMNLGNIHFINGKMELARTNFTKVLEIAPDNTYALLGFAKVSYELDDYPSVVSSFNKIETQDPAIAEKYKYLVSRSDDTSRASAAVKEAFEWDEE